MIYAKKDSHQQEIAKIAAKANGAIVFPYLALTKVSSKWVEVWRETIVIVNQTGQTLFDVDLFSLFNQPKSLANFIFINDGVIGAKQTDTSLLINGFPNGSKITVINNGRIIGRGGKGGYGGPSTPNLTPATDGGNAITLNNITTVINNKDAVIAGGGGGGGGCFAWWGAMNGSSTGGGGAGIEGGTGANAGTETTGGAGNSFNYHQAASVAGGKGGDLGKAGETGRATGVSQGGNVGYIGKAGKAINAQTTSTLINNGTLHGTNDLEK